MNYSELDLKKNTQYNVIQIKDKQVKVLQYLPIMDKIDLIDIALQKSLVNGVYNELLLQMYFNLYLIFMYTDLEFTDEEKVNLDVLYDELESNNVLLDIIGAMEQKEYYTLITFLSKIKENNVSYKHSAAALLSTFIQDMPKNAEVMSQIVDNFDKDKYKEVVEFAQNANGGRPI